MKGNQRLSGNEIQVVLRRERLIALVLINGAAVFAAVSFTAGSGESTLVGNIARALVFANLTGIFGLTVLSRVALGITPGRLPSAASAAVAVVGVTLLGCLAAQALLVATGFVGAGRFWRGYVDVVRVSLPLAVVFGLGAVFYESLRARIRVMEMQIHANEVATERHRKLVAEAQLRSLQARIHPHFLFNTLNSISSLISTDPRRAEQVVCRLAVLLRAALDSSPKSIVPLRDELALVESFLDIERIRVGGKLRASVSASPDSLDVQVPPMSILSLVENAIKHGIPAGGTLEVAASTARDHLRIEVRDTGPGFELDAIPSGHGLDELVVRLDVLFGSSGRLNVLRRGAYSVVEMLVPRS